MDCSKKSQNVETHRNWNKKAELKIPEIRDVPVAVDVCQSLQYFPYFFTVIDYYVADHKKRSGHTLEGYDYSGSYEPWTA